MHREVLIKSAVDLFRSLAVFGEFYLAGGTALALSERVDLGGQSSAQSALRAICQSLARRAFSRASAVLMSVHDGGIDHHVLVVVIAGQQLENTGENSALGPSHETLMDRFPVAETLRKITPGTPRPKAVENRFDEHTRLSSAVPPTCPSRTGRMFLIRSHWSLRNPRRSIGRPSLSRPPMNQSNADLGIRSVSYDRVAL